MESPDSLVREGLEQLLTRRGWVVSASGTQVSAHKHDWPAQLRVVIDPGSAIDPSIMGITIDFRSMPLGGERFRDIFNGDRERIMRGMGAFRVRQMRGQHEWNAGITDRVFLHGVDGGISRLSGVVLFDRCPEERGEALLGLLAVESNRLLETGGEIASRLQRTYNRTVLRNDLPVANLPELVVAAGGNPAPAVLGEPSYPWRR